MQKILTNSAESTQKTIESVLKQPPGRQPYKDDVELSNWYNNLPDAYKAMVLKVVEKTVEMNVFGFLCVLDGARAIEDIGEKGKLNVYYNNGDITAHLNYPNEEFLHDLW